MTSARGDFPLTSTVDRLAAIDIGSNSIRLVVAQPTGGGQFRVIDEEREATRLSKNMATSRTLGAAAIDASIAALRRFRKIAIDMGARRIETIATCAVREADNGTDFVNRIHSEAGLDVEVISAEEEALHAFRSVQGAFDISDQNIAIVDIGGGSTEIVFVSAGHVDKIVSTPLGAVRVTEKYGANQGLFGDEYDRLLGNVGREIKKYLKHPPFTPQFIYGTGGTFTALASMIIASRNQDAQMLWGYRVTRADVRHVLDRLSAMRLKERRGFPGLNADRADIIVAGIALIDRLMSRLRVNRLRVHTGGVRDGLLLSMLGDAQQLPETTSRLEIAERFANSCGADLKHGKHVATICGMLFDGMGSGLGLSPTDRELLQVAALLQDVGYLINYKQHHKHSYQLIVNSQLPGFRRHELEIVANLARYHRGAKPKKKHSNFGKLTKSDQRRVRHLTAILRIAGGLDRGHAERVQSVNVRMADNRVLVQVVARSDPDIELWAARSRAELFERVFSREVVIHTSSSSGASHPVHPATKSRMNGAAAHGE